MMFLYMAVNMLPGLRVNSEQAGDNLYYMGFIYTLTSLGVSLYKFTGESSIEDVVRNFGIAIISTVTGIALRIFFNQMPRDPADIKKAVRTELAEMTRRVRAELDNSAMEFSAYRRVSNQMLSEGFEEIARQAEKNGEAVRAAIEAMSSKAVESIQATSAQLLATLEESHKSMAHLSETNMNNIVKLSGQMEAVATTLTDKSKQVSDAFDSVIEKYSAARSPDEVLRIEVSPAIESIRTLVESHSRAIGENASDTRETAKKILAGLGSCKQTAANLTKLANEVNASTTKQAQSIEMVAKLASSIDEFVSTSRATNEAHIASSSKLSDLIAAAAGRHSEAKAAEEQSRRRGERIELAIEKLNSNSSQVNTVPVANGNADVPTSANATLFVHGNAADNDRPRKWWQR